MSFSRNWCWIGPYQARRLDALCCLLMAEAEDDCQSVPLYLEALVRELALAVLT